MDYVTYTIGSELVVVDEWMRSHASGLVSGQQGSMTNLKIASLRAERRLSVFPSRDRQAEQHFAVPDWEHLCPCSSSTSKRFSLRLELIVQLFDLVLDSGT